MQTKEFLQAVKKELEPVLVSRTGKKSGTHLLLFRMLHDIYLLRYVTPTHLRNIFSRYSQLTARLPLLVELGWLNNPHGNVYSATGRVNLLLKKLDYEMKLLPRKAPVGEGGIDSMCNTEIYVQALNLPNYIVLLHRQFLEGELQPDGLLVQGDKNSYRLIFLEVEKEKSNWEEHIIGKKPKYEALGECLDVYEYWCEKAPLLNLPIPTVEQFQFQVICVADKDFDWEWDGWEFRGEL